MNKVLYDLTNPQKIFGLQSNIIMETLLIIFAVQFILKKN